MCNDIFQRSRQSPIRRQSASNHLQSEGISYSLLRQSIAVPHAVLHAVCVTQVHLGHSKKITSISLLSLIVWLLDTLVDSYGKPLGDDGDQIFEKAEALLLP